MPVIDAVGGLVRTGAKWSIVLLVLRQLVGIGSVAVISRLLNPADFGLVAMTTTLIGFLNLITDMGMTWATVHERELDHGRVNTLFWVGAGLGATAWVAAIAVAPLLAGFYGYPELAPLCTLMGISLLVNGLAIQPVALLKRQIRQKSFAVIQTAASLAGAFVGILLAAAGLGYWALAGQTIAVPLVVLVLAIQQSSFVPGKPAFSSGIAPLLKFGGFVGMCNLITYFQTMLDSILVGYYGGAAELGYYSRASFLKNLPTLYAAIALTDVMVPALTSLQGDRQRLAGAYRRTIRAIAFVACPAGVLLGLTAPETVRIVYGPNWGPVVPILYLLAIPGIILPVYVTMGWLYLAAGKAREMFLQALVVTPLVGATFCWAAQWGALGVAWASVALLTVPIPLATLYFAHRAIGIELGQTLRSIGPILLAALGAALGGYLLGEVVSARGISWYGTLFIKTLAVFLLYAIAVLRFARPLPIPMLEQIVQRWTGRWTSNRRL